MLRRLLIIDALIIVFLLFGGLRLRQDWLEFWTTHRIENIHASPEAVAALPAQVASASTNFSEWTDIIGKNPFSFDRTDVPIIVMQPAPVVPVGPKPILFGTISLGAETLAMLGPGQPGNRNARPLHVGEFIEGWELVEIQEKSVIVRARDRRETVIMNDPTAQVPRDYTRTLSGTVAPLAQTVQTAPAQESNGRRATTPTDNAVQPPPADAGGRPKKGHWIKTPFGDAFVEDAP